MPRTPLTPVDVPANYAEAPVNMPWTAADNVNGNSVPCTGRETIIFRNDNVGVQTVTVSGVDCSHGRSEDCEKVGVPAGEYWITQMFPTHGWKQADGMLYIDAGAADVFIVVLKHP